MRGIGGLLAAYGFLSALLYLFDYHISILAWADQWQPAFGLIAGCVGMAFLGISLWTHREDTPPQQPVGPHGTPGGPMPNQIPRQGPQFGPRPPQGPPPQGPPPQYGPPPPFPPGGPTGFGPQGGPPYGPRG